MSPGVPLSPPKMGQNDAAVKKAFDSVVCVIGDAIGSSATRLREGDHLAMQTSLCSAM